MGLNIREIIPKKEIEIEDLKGKTVCVDAFNSLYQFLSTIRQADGTPLMDDKKRITSHLSGILYRNAALLEAGIKLVYVFDGKAPELKAKTREKRDAVKDQAKEKYEEAKQEEDLELMKRYSSMLVRINEEMLFESKELLSAMGVCVIEAPSEGEAEAAYLCRTKSEVYSAVSQDYDSLLFGAKRLIQNLTLSRKRKTVSGFVEVKPFLIDLELILKELEINQEQLICLGILVGTDYNPKGIPGIGQKKALQVVKEFKTKEKIFESVKEKIDSLEEKYQFNWEEIYNLFINHPVKDVDFVFPKLNKEKIKEILVTDHNFSEERVEKQIERLEEVEKAKKQTGLNKWF
jgi:flap endonuclease-1